MGEDEAQLVVEVLTVGLTKSRDGVWFRGDEEQETKGERPIEDVLF